MRRMRMIMVGTRIFRDNEKNMGNKKDSDSTSSWLFTSVAEELNSGLP